MGVENELGRREDGKRNFELVYDGRETGNVYSGATPRHAVLKAARDVLDPAESYAAIRENRDTYVEEVAMKEGSGRAGHATERVRLDGSRFQPECKVHVYDAWAWEEDAPADRPDWLGDTMVSVDVTKKGISRVQAYLDG